MWQIRPPVAMGLYASSFLALRSLPSLGAALRGIAAQHAIFRSAHCRPSPWALEVVATLLFDCFVDNI
jgi:hypothetical protein